MNGRRKSLLDATPKEIVQLQYDNFDAGGFWLLNDGYMVTIAKQKPGEKSTAKIDIPVKEFRKLIRKLLAPQRLTK